jgi:hypothetical protein
VASGIVGPVDRREDGHLEAAQRSATRGHELATRVSAAGAPGLAETRVNPGLSAAERGLTGRAGAADETRVSAGPAEVALSWSGSQSAPLAREDEASTRAPEELRTIGRYVVLSKIGAGGMGVVVRAYDPDLDRQVAIKVLRGHSTADARARLLREAQAMAKLSHPNVVSVFDVGLVGDQVFVAMDYIDGEDLGRWIDGGARPWREVVDVFMQAGAGLAAAHAAGLIHRDFKPLSTPSPTRMPLSQQIGCNPTNSGVLAGVAFFPERLRVPAVCPEPGKNQAKLSSAQCERASGPIVIRLRTDFFLAGTPSRSRAIPRSGPRRSIPTTSPVGPMRSRTKAVTVPRSSTR